MSSASSDVSSLPSPNSSDIVSSLSIQLGKNNIIDVSDFTQNYTTDSISVCLKYKKEFYTIVEKNIFRSESWKNNHLCVVLFPVWLILVLINSFQSLLQLILFITKHKYLCCPFSALLCIDIAGFFESVD